MGTKKLKQITIITINGLRASIIIPQNETIVSSLFYDFESSNTTLTLNLPIWLLLLLLLGGLKTLYNC